jgi:hypothetical protein
MQLTLPQLLAVQSVVPILESGIGKRATHEKSWHQHAHFAASLRHAAGWKSHALECWLG